jgi:inhibitor of cysteine peptidase
MKKILLIASLLAVILGLSACGSSKVKVGEEANGQTIELSVGQKLEIQLAGNPTTGFNWEVSETDESIIKQSGEAGYKSDSNLIGSGGMFKYTFEAVQPGTTTIKLIYHRSWEKDIPPEQEFTITVEVK